MRLLFCYLSIELFRQKPVKEEVLASMKKLFPFVLSLIVSAIALAQEAVEDDSYYTTAKTSYPLKLGLTSGPVFFFGDIKMEDYTPAITERLGYSFFGEQRITPYLNLSLNLFAGKVYGEKQDSTTNINFRTSLFSQSLNLQYNFNHFFNSEKSLLTPFVSVGVASVIFRPKADLMNGDNKTYYYWDRETIKDLPNTPQNQDIATDIERDYEYETELRDLDLDGIGKYPLIGLSLPFSAGVDVNITKGFSIRAQGTYHMTFTDHIDNITADGIGARQGNKGNDAYLYTSLGLVWQIVPIKPKVETKPEKDSDDEVIADIFDKDSETEENVTVDENSDTKDEAKETAKDEKPASETDLSDKKTYHWADVDKNGKIEATEVYEKIDEFLEGDSKITLQEMNDLLEYYFEQD